MASQSAAQDRVQEVANPYDVVAYNNRPHRLTHPDHLAMVARLHGLNPPDVRTARVLEVGTSEGGNIIPMAMLLPEAQFTGIDLAARPVEAGRKLIEDLGLRNIRLVQQDLMEVDASFGEFDYILVHGLYAWVPEPVRDKILAVIRSNMSSNGVAFVSYNTMPGGHMRMTLREALQLHVGDATDPREMTEKAREMLQWMAAGEENADPVRAALGKEARMLLESSVDRVFHDYLAGTYAPTYFRDFAAHAGRHGLRYVADANVVEEANVPVADAVNEAINALPVERVAREQYRDMVRLRYFRRSLLCHAWMPVKAEMEPEQVAGLYMRAICSEDKLEKESDPPRFRSNGGMTITTNHEGVVSTLRRLIGIYPESEQVAADADGNMVLELVRRGLLDLHTVPIPSMRGSESPECWPLARLQAKLGTPWVTTLDLRPLELADERGLEFLQKLDGSRNVDALAAEMGVAAEEVRGRIRWLASLNLFVS